MFFRWVEINAAFFIADKGIIIPTVPKSFHHFDKFMRALVTVFMIVMCFASEIIGLCLERRGHNIPCRAPAAHMIEGSHFASHVERFVVTGRRCANEADLVGDGSKASEQSQRLEMRGILRRA